MKRLPFRKVKILRKGNETEYSENLRAAYSKERNSGRLWGYAKNSIDFEHCNSEKYNHKWIRNAEKYERSLKKGGRKLHMKTFKWMVVDTLTNELIEEFDTIDQAKRFCIKNDYDFGLY